MTVEIAIVFALLLATFFAMTTEKLPPDIIALWAMGVLLGIGILSPSEAFDVFANEAAIAVGCMFVLSASLERTGALDQLGAATDRLVGQSDWSHPPSSSASGCVHLGICQQYASRFTFPAHCHRPRRQTKH